MSGLDGNKICLAYMAVAGGVSAPAVEAVVKEVGRQIAEKIRASAPTKYPEVGTVYEGIADDVLGWTGADHD